jgi:hypothetical protein
MNPEVIIITKKNEPYLNRLLNILEEHKIECYEIIHSVLLHSLLDKLPKFNTMNFHSTRMS